MGIATAGAAHRFHQRADVTEGKSIMKRLSSARVLLAAAAVLATGATAQPPTFEKLLDFNCSGLGCAPNGQLIQASDGYLYGTTSEGGETTDRGVVFRLSLDGEYRVLTEPARWFFEASDGLFYGTSEDGGASAAGAIYQITPNGAIIDLYSFDPSTATRPGPLVQGRHGSFSGIVGIPDSDLVRLFQMDPYGNVELMRPADERIRNVRMILSARNDLLYGTTYGGEVFRMNRNGQTRVLHTFPTLYVDIMQASDGDIYGSTIDGGTAGAGIIFRLSPSGKVTVLHEFDGGTGGANPYQAPIQGSDGYLYGTTGMGGDYGLGTIYRMDRAGVVTLLHSFGPTAAEGLNPVGEIVFATDGALYGTTVFGGVNGHGTAWRLRPPPR